MLANPRPSFLDLPKRSGKPRRTGLTHVLDKGCSVQETRNKLEQTADIIDIWKFGWGISYIDPNVRIKVAELRKAGVRVCTGGTLMEIAWSQGQAEPMLQFAAEAGFGCVEISDGAFYIPAAEKCALISRAKALGFEVLAEVGCKDPLHKMATHEWITEIEDCVAAGADWIVAEGRESGTVGLYEGDGSARSCLIDALQQSPHIDQLIYETPQRAQQSLMLRQFGVEVNLGNIQLDDVLGLETLRLGLRADTVDLLPSRARR